MQPYVFTAARRAAHNRNVRRSSGPRTAAGKRRSSLNRLRRGLHSERWAEALPAFGEGLKDFERLYEDLLQEWRPRTATGRQLVHQLAVLYWKFDRLVRVENAMAVRSLEKLEGERQLMEIARRQVALEKRAGDGGLSGLPDSPMKFRRMLRGLGKMRASLRRRDLHADYRGMLFELYGDVPVTSAPAASGGNPSPAAEGAHHPAPVVFAPMLNDASTPPASDEEFQSFEHLIDGLRERVELDFARYRLRQRGISPADRDAHLVPEPKEAALLIRRENSLFRQIDRTIRLLLLLEASPHGRWRDPSPSCPAATPESASDRPAELSASLPKADPTGRRGQEAHVRFPDHAKKL